MTEVVWTAPAVADLDAVHSFIARDSEFYANAFVSDLFDAVDRLAEFPRSGRMVPEMEDETVREVLVGSYRVMYDISGAGVHILAVLHMARRFRDPR